MLTGSTATLLLTVAARAAASRLVPELGFHDEVAEHLVANLAYDLSSYVQDLSFVRSVVLRSLMLDELAWSFFQQHPQGMGISLGVGLCTRRQRLLAQGLAGYQLDWVNIDLPEALSVRSRYLPADIGEHNISCSLLDESWFRMLDAKRPIMLIMEGVCPYLPASSLIPWFTALARHCQHSGDVREIALDYIDPEMLRMPGKIGSMSLPLLSGFEGTHEITCLHDAVTVLSEHHPFAQFSSRHSDFEAAFRMRTGRALYTIVHLSLRRDH